MHRLIALAATPTLFLGLASHVFAQRVATVSVGAAAIARGADAECRWDVTRAATQSANSPDSVIVRVVDPAGNATSSPAEVFVHLDGAVRHTISVGDTTARISLAVDDLAGRVVALQRADARNDRIVCAAVPFPTPLRALRLGEDETSFIADGAVGAGLRTGVGSSTVTGSLGIIHRSPVGPQENRSFPCSATKRGGKIGTLVRVLTLFHALCLSPLGGEHLKALVTLASAIDTLSDSASTPFIQALLAPAFAGGQIGSGMIDYYIFERRAHGGTHGYRIAFHLSRSVWRQTDTTPAAPTDTLPHHVTIIGLDPRWRWAFLDHPHAPRGNSFGFGVEVGLSLRYVTGEGWKDRSFREAIVGDDEDFFYGPAIGFTIQLRQVTAAIDLPILRHLERDIQPIIGIRFDAPFFTF